MTAFDKSLAKLLVHEGGYVNHIRDNGGMTNLGVTHKVWAEWSGKPATEAVMRGLTVAKVAPLYKARYWDTVGGDDLPHALAHCVFDMAVNSGPGRAVRWLQKLVNASQDGAMGPATRRATQAYVQREGLAGAVRDYQNQRRKYLHNLDDFDVFGRGWLKRVDRVETEALRFIP